MGILILLAFVLLAFAVQPLILWLVARICQIPDVGLLRATKTVAVLTTVQLVFTGLVLAIEMGPKTIADSVSLVLPLLFSLAAILAQLGIMWSGLRWLLRTTWPKAAGAGAIWWGLCMVSALCLALVAGVRGGIRDSYGRNGPDDPGKAQRGDLPDVRLPLRGQRQRSPQRGSGVQDLPCHLPDVPLHGRPGAQQSPEPVVPDLRRRPRPGSQVSLRVRRPETLGHYRFQIPGRRHAELHQAAGRVAR